MNCIRLLQLAEKQSLNFCKIQSAGYASKLPLRFLETQNLWRDRDDVSKRWQLIYKAPMNTALKFASAYLTFTTGVVGAGGIYYAAFVFDAANLDKPIVIGEDVVIANSPIECLVYVGSFIAIHLAISSLLSKYVVRLYQNGDEYLAIYRGHLFNSVRKHKFHLNEFEKDNPSVVIPWSESRYSLGKKKGILLENYFKAPEYFNYLLYKQSKNMPED